MIPDKLLEVLKHEGVVAIATQGQDGPHLVNTWNSYLQISQDGSLLIPVGAMVATEANLAKNKQVLVTLGSREVEGLRGPGTGFLIKGSATFMKSGTEFDTVKQKFPWARAALKVSDVSASQTI